jgi:hypothetical protein
MTGLIICISRFAGFVVASLECRRFAPQGKFQASAYWRSNVTDFRCPASWKVNATAVSGAQL